MDRVAESAVDRNRGAPAPLTAVQTASSVLHRTSSVQISFYRPELDALRFAAFLAVFLFHILPDSASKLAFIRSAVVKDLIVCITSSLSFGVCLFFVLSAYLITTLLLRERHKTNTVNLAAFYMRRVLRIWPLYLLALCFAFAVCSASRGFPGYKVVAAYVLFSGNLLRTFHLSTEIRPLKIFHLWSISVEEQFYLIFPGISRLRDLRMLPAICIVIVVTSVAALIHLSHAGTTKAEIWQNSFVQFMMFAAGIAIASLFDKKPLPQLSVRVRTLVALLGVTACFSAQYFCRIGNAGIYISAPYAVCGYLLVMAGCSAFLLSFLGFSGSVPPFLIYLGKISYGLYVFHIWGISLAAYLVTLLLHIPVAQGTGGGGWAVGKSIFAFCVTVGLAACSYRFIEKPFLRIKGKFEAVVTRAA